MAKLVACLLFLVAAVHAGRHDKYEGHQLYRISSSNAEIAYLEAKLDILSATPVVRSSSGQLEALIRLSPEEKQQWLDYFQKKGIAYTKIVDNLANILRDEEAKILMSKRVIARDDVEENEIDSGDENESANESESTDENGSSDDNSSNDTSNSDESSSSDESNSSSDETEEDNESGWDKIRWDSYYRTEEINAFLDDLGTKYPNLVTVINADLSFEGRQIKYVRISTSRFENLRKPLIVIDAAMHAREWITTPVAMYIINQLVVDIADNDLVDRLDWIIIPMANPDGYEYSIDEDRMWRKTRSRNHIGANECPGVDGNRNFDHLWGTNEGAADPCALIYQGPSPFSEPEVRVVQNVINQNPRTAMYISLHSFGNMFLYAWGNNGTLPSNGISLHLAANRMATAIEELALEKADRYIVGNAAQVLYFTTGTSRDWTRAVGVPLTYTLELPGYEYGFLVPAEYVSQVVTETWAGIAEGAKYVISLYY